MKKETFPSLNSSLSSDLAPEAGRSSAPSSPLALSKILASKLVGRRRSYSCSASHAPESQPKKILLATEQLQALRLFVADVYKEVEVIKSAYPGLDALIDYKAQLLFLAEREKPGEDVYDEYLQLRERDGSLEMAKCNVEKIVDYRRACVDEAAGYASFVSGVDQYKKQLEEQMKVFQAEGGVSEVGFGVALDHIKKTISALLTHAYYGAAYAFVDFGTLTQRGESSAVIVKDQLEFLRRINVAAEKVMHLSVIEHVIKQRPVSDLEALAQAKLKALDQQGCSVSVSGDALAGSRDVTISKHHERLMILGQQLSAQSSASSSSMVDVTLSLHHRQGSQPELSRSVSQTPEGPQ